MKSNLERYKTDLSRLIKLGEKMDLDLTLRDLEKTGR
jgi:hypothetical protein